MNLEDEVFGKCIAFFPNKTSNRITFQDWEEDEAVEILEPSTPSGYCSKLL